MTSAPGAGSRLEPFKRLAGTFKQRFERILAYIPERLNNGRTEGESTNGACASVAPKPKQSDSSDSGFTGAAPCE